MTHVQSGDFWLIQRRFSFRFLQVFEVFEPLRFHNLSDAQKVEVLQAFLTLKFTPSSLWEKDYYPPFWDLEETSYHIERLENKACIIFETKPTTCFPADALAENFIKKSKQKYDSTVVKELSERLPDGRLLSLLPLISDQALDADIRILHVVRDPRASINSRIKLRWFPEFNDSNFEENVRNYCKPITDNIEFGKTLDEALKHRYKLIFYRDIAARPLDTAREIFKFAGFNLSENTLEWIKNMTNPGKTDARKFKSWPYSLIRDAEANIEKWRRESPPARTLGTFSTDGFQDGYGNRK